MRIGAQRSLDEPSAWQAFAAHGKIKCARAASAVRELFDIGRAQFGAFKIVKTLNVKAEKSADSEVVRTQRSASNDASHADSFASAGHAGTPPSAAQSAGQSNALGVRSVDHTHEMLDGAAVWPVGHVAAARIWSESIGDLDARRRSR